MYYCQPPYEGLLDAQVCVGVIEGTLRPEFDPACPAPYRSLAQRCWSQEAADRPPFGAIWQELARIELDFRAAWHREVGGGRTSTDVVREQNDDGKAE
jgi:hypothetical protein